MYILAITTKKAVSLLCTGYGGMLPVSFEINKSRYWALSDGIHK